MAIHHDLDHRTVVVTATFLAVQTHFALGVRPTGVAAGIIQPLVMVVAFQVFPTERRGYAMAIYSMGVFMAVAVGPIVGGVAIDLFHWRYIFWAPLPVILLAAFMGWLFVPQVRSRDRSRLELLFEPGLGALRAQSRRGVRTGPERGAGQQALCVRIDAHAVSNPLVAARLREIRTPVDRPSTESAQAPASNGWPRERSSLPLRRNLDPRRSPGSSC